MLKVITKHEEFLMVLQQLCLFENNEVCFLTLNTIIKLCQLEKDGHKFLVCFARTTVLCSS